MSSAFPKSARLRTQAVIRRVLRHGFVHAGAECVVRALRRTEDGARLGIAAPWRYGNAIRRNRFRRLVREAFRSQRTRLGPFDVLVTPRKVLETPTLGGIARDIRVACERARRADTERDA